MVGILAFVAPLLKAAGNSG